jgi:hypothetical protein
MTIFNNSCICGIFNGYNAICLEGVKRTRENVGQRLPAFWSTFEACVSRIGSNSSALFTAYDKPTVGNANAEWYENSSLWKQT